MTIAIIDYGSGNLRSAQKAFARMAQGQSVVLTAAPDTVAKADHIVLPGVGAFGDCAQGLAAIDGMVQALTRRVMDDGRPFLGICVGMQLICATGYERGTHDGLAWLDAVVKPIHVPDALKVPHMGWNNIRLRRPHAVLDGLDDADFYFVHGYAPVARAADIVAQVDYGNPLVAVLARDNIIGTQFHPEKSQHAGLQLIGNFLAWRP